MKEKKIRVKILEDSDEKIQQWDAFVSRHKFGNIFYSFKWLKVIEEGLGYTPVHLIVEKENNIIECFPCFMETIGRFKRLSSIPQGASGFLLGKYAECSLKIILEKINELCHKESLVSHRITIKDLEHLQFGNYLYQNNYELYLSGCRFIINLNKPLSEIEKNFSSARKYEIRKVKDYPIEIKEVELSFKNIQKFYSIYQMTMKRVGGNILPFTFFEKLIQYLKPQIKIFIALYKKDWIAGFLHLLDYKNQIIYHYFGASKDEYKNLFPNVLLHYYSIKWAHDAGFKWYDMYGSSFFTDSIFIFKKQWGGNIIPNFVWERCSNNLKGLLYKIGKSYIKKSKNLERFVKKIVKNE